MKRLSNSVTVLLVAAFLLISCSPAAYAVDLYNEGQALYIGADQAYSDFVACQTFNNQSIEQTMALTYSYNWTVLQQNENYRKAFNAPTEAAALAPKATADDGSQITDFNKLPDAATPDNIFKSGLSFSVYAVQEAQVIPVPPEITKQAIDYIQVANNHKFQCAKSWNAAAAAYNLWRRQVEGRIVGDLADYFNIEDMPKTLPMFTVTDFQTGAAPDTTNPYAPTVAP